jgi:hypothetical protein
MEISRHALASGPLRLAWGIGTEPTSGPGASARRLIGAGNSLNNESRLTNEKTSRQNFSGHRFGEHQHATPFIQRPAL